ETGEVLPIAIVTDNGAAFRSAAFARYIASRPEFTHVRTRHRSPQTNGVIERFFQALKYEHLYRNEIGDGATLAAAVDCHQTVYKRPVNYGPADRPCLKGVRCSLRFRCVAQTRAGVD